MKLEALNAQGTATSVAGLVCLLFCAFSRARIWRILKRIRRAAKSYLHRSKHARKPGAHRFEPSRPHSNRRLDGSRSIPARAVSA